MQKTILVSLIALLGFFTIYQSGQIQLQSTQNIRKDLFSLYNNWKIEHEQSFDGATDQYRFAVFQANYEYIQKYNKQVGYEATGLTINAALTNQEFKEKFLTATPIEELRELPEISELSNDDIPSQIDWVQKGAVQPVQDAGQCNSSWAISVSGALSSIYQIVSKSNIIPFSAQQIISCDKNCGGCSGGSELYSYLYAMQYGMESDETYPYTSKFGSAGSCKYESDQIIMKPTNAYQIKSSSPDIMKQVVAKQPITARVDATDESFQHYRGGETPYHSNFCLTDGTENVRYTVLVTGYNDNNERPYWILQASFGTKWGNDGYMWLQNKAGTGYCGINRYPKFPGYEK